MARHSQRKRLVSSCSLISALIGLLALATSAQGQTTGFITTRPTCVPPTSTGIQDQVNYIQGADPIRLANGDVAILVDAGQCCGSGHWEGIFSLVYPGPGTVGVPRFNPIYGSNDFGNHNTSPKEHEAPFPSAIYHEGKWRIVYTSTFFPTTQTNRDRVARIDVDNLTFRAAQSQVTNQWIKPVSTACKNLGSCTGKGSGVLATIVRHPNGDLYVYHPDGNYPSCATGWIRHKIGSNMTVLNPNGSDGCLSWQGRTDAPPYISDMARGADGNLYMLSSETNNISDIFEWTSTGTSSTIGLSWTKTGRKWTRPAHPQPPRGYSVWDGGYLKDADRQIVEPKVVVAQISDGTSFSEIVDASLGRWYLYYWADAGASLPPAWAGNATSCAFAGNHDQATCTAVAGWNWDPEVPNSPHFVDLYDGSKKIASVPANLYRGDLQAAGKGNGVHAFNWPVPLTLKNGVAHSLTVKHGGTTTNLSNSPKSITCSSSVQARVIWIQPQPLAGFGPAGSLVIAGSASGAPGTGVKLWYRDVLANGPWTTKSYMPIPDANNIWYHSIPNADYWRQYDVYIVYGGGNSLTCSYQGFNAVTNCP